jgi:hypothetical protein
MELLFESRLEIEKLEGKLRWVQQRARIAPEPVLLPSNSGDGSGVSIYGTVMHDGGRYRMWYQGWPQGWDGDNSPIVCHAESDDGIAWTKPDLQLDDRFPGPQNITDLGLHSPAVFLDPDAPPSQRYRATGFAHVGKRGANRAFTQGSGYVTAHSADGLHWQLDQLGPTWFGSDVITSIYHPGQKRGMIAFKQPPRYGGIQRRAVWTAEYRAGHWTSGGCALVPDSFDDVAAIARGLASGDYYGMAMRPAGRGTVGFLWHFRHALPRTLAEAGDGSGVFGPIDVGLTYQADEHSCWIHAPGRQDFIAGRDVPWRPDGAVCTAAAPITVGDEERLYLCASYAHGWYVDANWKINEDSKARLLARGLAQIGYAYWPRHRLFGYRAEPTGAIRINIGKPNRACKLRLNVELLHPDGYATVAIAGHDTLTHENCHRIATDSLAAEVAWKSSPVIPLNPDRATRVQIALHDATLWAWELPPA